MHFYDYVQGLNGGGGVKGWDVGGVHYLGTDISELHLIAFLEHKLYSPVYIYIYISVECLSKVTLINFKHPETTEIQDSKV